jgi:hypothetical protein
MNTRSLAEKACSKLTSDRFGTPYIAGTMAKKKTKRELAKVVIAQGKF